jgi:AraC-like DNA-binding protein
VEVSARDQHRASSRQGEAPQSRDQHRGGLDLSHSFPAAVRSDSLDLSATRWALDPFTAASHAPRSLRMRAAPGRSGPRVTKGLAPWQELVLLGYIEKHGHRSINLRELARFVYLSLDDFGRAFKRSFGMPPRRYLIQQRIERAETLLAHSALSVKEVGLALGFSQARAFSVAFRGVTGITPTKYRQMQRCGGKKTHRCIMPG